MNAPSNPTAPTTLKRTVSRGRLPNGAYRTREYLTEREVERLIKAAGDNRHGHRDATSPGRRWEKRTASPSSSLARAWQY